MEPSFIAGAVRQWHPALSDIGLPVSVHPIRLPDQGRVCDLIGRLRSNCARSVGSHAARTFPNDEPIPVRAQPNAHFRRVAGSFP